MEDFSTTALSKSHINYYSSLGWNDHLYELRVKVGMMVEKFQISANASDSGRATCVEAKSVSDVVSKCFEGASPNGYMLKCNCSITQF